jgi:hypothetical protein
MLCAIKLDAWGLASPLLGLILAMALRRRTNTAFYLLFGTMSAAGAVIKLMAMAVGSFISLPTAMAGQIVSLGAIVSMVACAACCMTFISLPPQLHKAGYRPIKATQSDHHE